MRAAPPPVGSGGRSASGLLRHPQWNAPLGGHGTPVDVAHRTQDSTPTGASRHKGAIDRFVAADSPDAVPFDWT
jgi:hypothetical protein